MVCHLPAGDTENFPEFACKDSVFFSFSQKIMRKICLYILLFLSLTAYSASYAPADVPNPKSTDYRTCVANPDGILSDAACAVLNQIGQQLQKEVEVELAVVAIDEMKNADAEGFALKLFNTWGVGNKDKNTGIMILLVTGSRDIRIQTGGGLEGLLPDGKCGEIIDVYMLDDLSNNRWNEALIAGAQTILDELTTDAAKTELLLGFVPKTTDIADGIITYLIIACLILCILAYCVYKDTNLPANLTTEERIRRGSGTWSLCKVGSIFFPLPILLLLYWFYRHGGKEIQAMQTAQARAARLAAEAEARQNGGGFYLGGSGRGGFGGGSYGGGSFGGGMSFGGGAGRHF